MVLVGRKETCETMWKIEWGGRKVILLGVTSEGSIPVSHSSFKMGYKGSGGSELQIAVSQT